MIIHSPEQQYIIDEFNEIKQSSIYKQLRNRIKFSYKKDIEKYVYYFRVWQHTENNKHLVPNINLRGKDYHLDHIIPISAGYKFGIPAEQIGDVSNLRIISNKDNFLKNSRTDINLPIIKRQRIYYQAKDDIDSYVGGSISKYPKGGSW